MKTPLAAEYEATCERTLAQWALSPDSGPRQAPVFHPTRLSITSGNHLSASPRIVDLLRSLRSLAGEDPLADVVGPDSMHFTFLAITLPSYDSFADLPTLNEARVLFDESCAGESFSLGELRLVALPNAILLAGQPDFSTWERRKVFAGNLLASSWKDLLQARYPGGTIPPLFWHSTLLRYRAKLLPSPLRRFFVSRRNESYGSVSLAIRLLATNYNWKISFPLDELPEAGRV